MGFSADVTTVTNALGLTSPATPPLVENPLQSIPVDLVVGPDLSRKIQGFSSATLDNWNINPTAAPYFFKIAPSVNSGVSNNSNSNVGTYVLDAAGLSSDTFLFYIPPSAISVQNVFAINVAATNQGILEEHNGMVFRNIQISGVTGLWPNKPNRMTTSTPGVISAVQSLFPSTTSAISALAQKTKSVAKAVVGGSDNDLDKSNTKLLSVAELSRTGWFQFWQLNNFLIAYSEYKKNAGMSGSDVRLIFASTKDNIGYVVTPLSFTLKRDITNPLLYRYDITLKAWDITTPYNPITLPQADIPTPDSQSIVAAVANVLTDARSTITAATNVLQGVSTDLLSVVNVYNQALLLYNDTAGLVSDVETFGPTFQAQAQSLLLNSSRNQAAILNAVNDPSVRTGNMPATPTSVATPVSTSKSLSAATAKTLSSLGVNTSKSSSLTTPGGQQITDPKKQSISPQANTLVNTALSTSGLKSLTIDQLDIPSSIQAGIDSTRAASQALTAGDIYTLASNIQEISDNYSISLGSMDPTYAATYDIAVTSGAANTTPTEDDIILQVALQDSKTSFLSTLATGQFFLERDPDPFLDANSYIQPQDQLQTPNSSIAVPFQRGSTLDTLAQQYLGDAKRSREIEVLNYLRAPYIDEVGFTLPILTPTGRTFVVTDISNLTINQQITISSTSAVSTQRTILNITNIGNNEWQIVVDGLPNLSLFTPSSNPTLFTYLPGTVGPGDTILIPSSAIPNQFVAIRPTPLFDTLSNSNKVFLVDMALDSRTAQDLSVGPTGDVGLSYGYNNATQALRIGVEVEQGELDRHPTYGLAVPIGSRNSDISPTTIENAVQSTITNDPRFVDADVIVNVNGDVVSLQINATGASGTGQIPVNFEIGVNPT